MSKPAVAYLTAAHPKWVWHAVARLDSARPRPLNGAERKPVRAPDVPDDERDADSPRKTLADFQGGGCRCIAS
jgi:hypothetical protein